MGQVWVALDTDLDRRVALKLPLIATKDSPDRMQGFWSEARALARVSHPNVVKVFDVGEDGEQPYIVMELVGGYGLDILLTEQGALAYDEALNVGGQIAMALAAAHNAGLVHRDLKPANVLIRPDSDQRLQAILVDFGLAISQRTRMYCLLQICLGHIPYYLLLHLAYLV